jgi:hypothetical protein
METKSKMAAVAATVLVIETNLPLVEPNPQNKFQLNPSK